MCKRTFNICRSLGLGNFFKRTNILYCLRIKEQMFKNSWNTEGTTWKINGWNSWNILKEEMASCFHGSCVDGVNVEVFCLRKNRRTNSNHNLCYICRWIVENHFENNIIRYKKLSTIVLGRKNLAWPFVRRKQVSMSAEM